MAVAAKGFDFEWVQETAGRARLELRGAPDPAHWAAAWPRLMDAAAAPPGTVAIDLDQLERLDGVGAALLVELRAHLRRGGAAAEFVGVGPGPAALLALHAAGAPRGPTKPAPAPKGVLAQVGEFVQAKARGVRDVLSGIGETAAQVRAVIADPRTMPWRDVVRLFERSGPDAVPIVALISALVGMILAFQAAMQLVNFGAEIFVANLVGLSVVRELGPLMAAILLAGRSGAAIAAELGTMRVSEEIDALRALGISPHRQLVLPRLLALVLCAPALTLVADAFGIGGGLLVASGAMGISPVAYWNQTVLAVDLWDVGTGLVKAVAFGAIVALVAADRGLSTRGGAEGVGRSTTSAVVTTILLLVVADALFAFAFHRLGI